MYLEPEMEVLEIQLSGIVCTSDPEVPTGGGEGEDTPGGW